MDLKFARAASRMAIIVSVLFSMTGLALASETYVLRSAPIHRSSTLRSSTTFHPKDIADSTAATWMVDSQYAIMDPDDPDTVRSASTRKHKRTTSHPEVVAFARRYRGTPYVWGGTTSRGFDCSGFVRYVYAHLGHSLPRTASEQFHVGKKITYKDLHEGDILFFHTSRPGVSHVGIYIGGNKFIHAANPREGVIVSSLTGYYANRLVGARRVK